MYNPFKKYYHSKSIGSFFVCFLSYTAPFPQVAGIRHTRRYNTSTQPLQGVRTIRLSEDMSAKDTACLTRCLSTLATISVAAPSSPVNGSCLLLTATSRKNITSIALLHFPVTWLKYARLLENFGIVVRSVCCEMYCKHIKHKHPAPGHKDIHPVSNS